MLAYVSRATSSVNGQLEIIGTAGDIGGGAVAEHGGGSNDRNNNDNEDESDDDDDDGDMTNVYAKQPTITLRFVDAAGKSLTPLTFQVSISYNAYPLRASNTPTASLFVSFT